MGQLTLHPQAIKLSLRGVDVLIDVPQAGWPQWNHRAGISRKRTEVLVGDWYRSTRYARRELHAGIVRRVLDYVEGYVAEIAFITRAKAPAQAGFAITENIEGKAYTWRNRAPIRVPHPAHRAVRRNLNRASAESVINGGSGAEVKIGV